MAILALQAEGARVDLWFGMALDTFGRCIAETWLAVWVRMAILAGYFGMFTIQDEVAVMIKVFHPVNAVMAFQAGGAILCLVILHEGLVGVRVTVNAGLHGGRLAATGAMAGLAIQWISLVVQAMQNQAEGCGGGMIKRLPIQLSLSPVYGGVAGGTILLKHAQVCGRFLVAILTNL